jgi:sec-independent protein translocase protein TatA
MGLAILAGFGGQEMIVIAVIAVVLFGATRVPLFMRGLGQGIKEFKDALKDDKDEKESTTGKDNGELPSRPIASDQDDQDDPDGTAGTANKTA